MASEKLPIDINRMYERLDEMAGALERIRKMTGLDEKDFEPKSDNYAIAAFNLRLIFEAAITIAAHLATRTPGQRESATYASLLKKLGELNIIPQNLADRIQIWAKIRNRLTHDYYLVVGRELRLILREELPSIDSFVKTVGDYLKVQKL